MTDPLRRISTRSTPQTQPDPLRPDQVRNSAGGYTFRVDDMQRLRRFLVLGTDGGTYYASEQKLTKENAEFIIELVNRSPEMGQRVVDEVRIVSLENLAPRQKATLFTLAVAASSVHLDVRRAALAAVTEVCRTGTMLFNFVEYAQQFRGWGPSLRKEVARWYNEMPHDKLALQVVKYRQRDGWTHRDVLRKVHPTTTDERRNSIYRWVTHRDEPGDITDLPVLISAYEAAQIHGIAPDVIVALIENANLPWEAIPDEHLRHPAVMEALVPRMGLTALTRQLGRMASAGHLTPGSTLEKLVLERLRRSADDTLLGVENQYVKARVHPFQMLLALTTYQSGQGVRGKLTWHPTNRIVDALDAGFYAAFGSLPKSDKRTLVALDVSGSMGWGNIANTHITPAVGSAAMAMITMASTDANIMGFSHELVPLDISPRQRLDDVVNRIMQVPMGGTDCALPMVHALKQKLEVDTFVVYTDNETWAGHIHPHQALKKYREMINPNAKLVVVGMTTTNFTIADPRDSGMMDVVGFDASAPRVIQDFSENLVS